MRGNGNGNTPPADIVGWERASEPGTGIAPGPGRRGVTPDGRIEAATLPPYWLEKPPTGVDAYFRETAALAAVAGAEVLFGVTAPLPFRIPRTNRGVVSFVNIFVDAPNATIDVTWTLLVNGAPVPGWDRLGTFPRVALNLNIVYPGTVHLPKGATVTVRVRNNVATGPWTVGAEVGGWHWPAIAEEQAFGYR